MRDWIPDPRVTDLIRQYGGAIRGFASSLLYEKTRFLLNDRWWMLGITLSDGDVVFHPRIKDKPVIDQACAIYHELTHVAQWRDYGFFGFIGTYVGQWFRSGCSYDRMKSKGLEKEAIREAENFRRRCLGIA